MFGNIIAIYNASGTKVANYCYDAWGNCTVLTNTNGIGTMNPFRYRGYYLDTETNLYYLQSRYYDSYVGRFINADGQLNRGLLGNNLFTYCYNNPISFYDPSGRDAAVISDGLMFAASVLPFVDGPLPIGEILAGICLTAVIIIGARQAAKFKAETDAKAEESVDALPNVRSKVRHDTFYQVAFVNDRGELVRMAKKLTFEEAVHMLRVTGMVNQIAKAERDKRGMQGRLISGIYTHDQRAARALAEAVDGSTVTEWHGPGQFGHYHSKGGHYHIWYGGPIY